MKKIRYGFVPPVHDSQDKVFGGFNSLSKVVLQPNRNWGLFLPMYERQHGNGWDSFGCVPFGTLNALETILKRLTGEDQDFAERYIYNLAEVTPPGSDPKKIAQTIHENGVIEQKELPYIDSLKEFSSPRPMTKEYIEKGHKWLEEYHFGYEWVYEDGTSRQERLKRIKECLQYSPLGVSVTAWHKNSNGEYYSPDGVENNHWCLAYMVDDQDRIWCFDTYDSSIKTLSADHNIQYCMRYHVVQKRENLKQQVSLLTQIVELLKKLLGLRPKIEEMEYIPLPEKPMETPKPDYLTLLFEAMRDYEGKPGDLNYRNNNPLNCRCSKVGYLLKYAPVKCVNRFAVFSTWEIGCEYGRNLILTKARKHPEWNLVNFIGHPTEGWAPAADGNDPQRYASWVAKKMGVNPFTFTLKELV